MSKLIAGVYGVRMIAIMPPCIQRLEKIVPGKLQALIGAGAKQKVAGVLKTQTKLIVRIVLHTD